MNLKEEFEYIDSYFSKISKETLINDLIECGLGKISTSEASGYVLMVEKEPNYPVFASLMGNEQNYSMKDIFSNQSEAA